MSHSEVRRRAVSDLVFLFCRASPDGRRQAAVWKFTLQTGEWGAEQDGGGTPVKGVSTVYFLTQNPLWRLCDWRSVTNCCGDDHRCQTPVLEGCRPARFLSLFIKFFNGKANRMHGDGGWLGWTFRWRHISPNSTAQWPKCRFYSAGGRTAAFGIRRQ